MKRAFELMGIVVVMCILIPTWLASRHESGSDKNIPQEETVYREETSPEEKQQEGEKVQEEAADSQVMLKVLMKDNTVQEMKLETYLVGVLLGEMPTEFPDEAQKAQAVVCRTYTLHGLSSGKHDGADICVNSGCCQAWRNPEESPKESVEKAEKAVQDTAGEVLTYDGKLIDATFFSASGGRTEPAVAVWGSDIPYLQAVDSPGENAPYDEDRKTFSADEFHALILDADREVNLTGQPEQWLGDTRRTEGGGVETMVIGGRSFSGKALRSILGLRSTNFEAFAENGELVFVTHGYGHRVGMSQYGARAMAEAGSSYDEILNHYYTGVTLSRYQG